LGWTPKTSFADLVAEMVKEDLKEAQCEELLKPHGFPAVFGSRIAS
jgi:GDPmannose 4,6-dehydratase